MAKKSKPKGKARTGQHGGYGNETGNPALKTGRYDELFPQLLSGVTDELAEYKNKRS